MVAAFAEIAKWAQKLPYWQQFALSQVISGSPTNDELCEKAFAYFLEDVDIHEKKLERPLLRFLEQIDFNPSGGRAKLKSIGNLQNINALVPAQTLTVGSNLTTVFGSNGAGKSGYARVMASAGFSRGTREVLPDATKENAETSVMFAEFGFDTGLVRHQVGARLTSLSGYFVFDSESIPTHLTKANAISFSPAGLSCLKDLVAITENVAQRLEVFVAERKAKSIVLNVTPGESQISPLVSGLSAETDLDGLKRASIFDAGNETRLSELEAEISRLSQQDVSSLLKRNDALQRDLQQLLANVERVERLLTEVSLREVNESITAHNENLAAAKVVSVEQFQTNGLGVIGSDEWDHFVKAAQKLASQQALVVENYPSEGDVCLLCHQPLPDDACHLLIRTFQYAEGEAQRKVGQSAIVIENLKRKLQVGGITYGTERISYEYVLEKNPSLPQLLVELNSSAARLVSELTNALLNLTNTALPIPAVSSCSTKINELLEQLSAERRRLQEANIEQIVADLRKEHLSLCHRRDVSKQLSVIETYVLQERKCSEMLGKTPKTQGITTKHNQLFSEVVTEKYVALFKQYLDSFVGGSVRITVKMSGSKGETLRQIILEGTTKAKSNLTKVLSEGEQRAVALADFLTEVTLNDECDGLILDDPVTSFALEWREIAAKLIAQIAKNKQVVVLTHDLAFLYWLQKCAEAEGVSTENHWMLRESDGKPGYVYLNNGPATEKFYRDSTHALAWYNKAKDAQPQDRQVSTIQGFGALRTSYEVIVMDVLFKGVVKRFEERISIDSLKEVKWNQPLVDKLIQNYSELCRRMEGHSHSDALSSGVLQPADLLESIKKFDEIKGELRNLSKSSKPTPLKLVEPKAINDPVAGL